MQDRHLLHVLERPLRIACGLAISTLTACITLSLDEKHACSTNVDCLNDRVCELGQCVDDSNDTSDAGHSDGATQTDDGSSLDDGSVDADGTMIVPEAEPDLLLTMTEGKVRSLYTVNPADFSQVRKLDPRVTSSARTAGILGYSPSGRNLLVSEQRANGRAILLSRPCRAAPCTHALDPYTSLISAPSLTTDSGSQQPFWEFSPDENSILFSFKEGIFYVSINGTLLGNNVADRLDLVGAKFIANGLGVIGSSGGSESRVKLVDLRRGRTPKSLFPDLPEANQRDQLDVVSPDGAHFAAHTLNPNYSPAAFDSELALAGDSVGRPLSGGAVYATNHRLVTYFAGLLSAERWDGSNRISIASGYWSSFQACGDRIAGYAPDGKLRFGTLPGAEEASTLQFDELVVPRGDIYFTRDCSRLRVLVEGDDYLLDFATKQISRSNLIASGVTAISDDGSLFVRGSGISYVYRVVPPDEPRLAFNPGPQQIYSSLTLGRRHPFFVAAAAMEDRAYAYLYRVDMSDVSSPKLEKLFEPTIAPAYVALSSDDRYASFMAEPPSYRPHDGDPNLPGLYETDLSSKTTRKLAYPSRELSGGVISAGAIPGTRSIAVVGNYESGAPKSLFTTDLDVRGSFASMVPPDRARWPIDNVLTSADGKLIAVKGSSELGPTVWVQTAPAAGEAKVLAEYTMGPRYSERYLEMDGFAGSLGLVFRTNDQGLFRFNLQSGVPVPLLDGQKTHYQVLISEAKSRLALTYADRSSGHYQGVVGFIDGHNPDKLNVVIASDVDLPSVALSPDGRYLLYQRRVRDEAGYETGVNLINLYDLDARVDYPIASESGFTNDSFGFSTSGERVLLREVDGTCRVLNLTGAAPVDEWVRELDPSFHSTIWSGDLSWAVFADAWGEHALTTVSFVRLASDDAPVSLQIAGELPSLGPVSPNSRYIVASTPDHGYLLDTEHPEAAPTEVVGHTTGGALRFDPSSRYLVTSAPQPTVWRISDLATPHVIDVKGTLDWEWSWVPAKTAN